MTPPHTTQAQGAQGLGQVEIKQPLLLRASRAPNCSHLLPLGNLGEGLARVFPVFCCKTRMPVSVAAGSALSFAVKSKGAPCLGREIQESRFILLQLTAKFGPKNPTDVNSRAAGQHQEHSLGLTAAHYCSNYLLAKPKISLFEQLWGSWYSPLHLLNGR